MAAEILGGWAPIIRDLRLLPASGGAFEVTLDEELIFSKKAAGRHAEPGEVTELLRRRMGPELLDR
ncbi:MAG: Rdx family protein [Actinobacteria bacterium]|nr:Rdx family protein [Actinomycetota bacterium]